MINTLYSLDAFDTALAFFLALLTGFGFGFTLERFFFSSSQRLASVFYFINMTVVKVMISTLVIVMLVFLYMVELEWIHLSPTLTTITIYGTQIVGGLLFGIGFVMGAWRPNTVAVDLTVGRINALVFLLGTIGGSILFNHLLPVIRLMYPAWDQDTLTNYIIEGMARNKFVIAFTVVVMAVFWLAEWAEKTSMGRRAPYIISPFLKVFSLILVALAGGLFVLSFATTVAFAKHTSVTTLDEKMLIERSEQALDYIDPEELANLLMSNEPDFVTVDVRSESEFNSFHIRGAINVPFARLAETLQLFKNKGLIVLYSNGTAHPVRVRDSLRIQGFDNIYMLTDGLQGFRDHCLKFIPLQSDTLTTIDADRVNAWRVFFSGSNVAAKNGIVTPRTVEAGWLSPMLGTPGLKVIDLRPQQEYNAAHIPDSLNLNVETLRSNIGTVPHMLLPTPVLAAQFSRLGLQPSDTVVLVCGNNLYDSTLAGMALERLGHMDYAIMNGGYAKWPKNSRPSDTSLPAVKESIYQAKKDSDDFTVDFRTVVDKLSQPGTVIIDVRPADFYTGKISDEACAGHIPGAINRAFTEDITITSNNFVSFKFTEVLAAAYSQLIPSKNTEVIVYGRTGHQASQTFFVLKHLLGYPNVRWYDAGWIEWAARLEIEIINEKQTSRNK